MIMESTLKNLKLIFGFAIISEPIVSNLHGFFDSSAGSIISLLQLHKGLILCLLTMNLLRIKGVFLSFPSVSLPLILLGLYSLLNTGFFDPSFASFSWSLRPFYVATIFLTAYCLALFNQLQEADLTLIAAIVIFLYFASQILAMLMGFGGLKVYRTEFGSAGFGLRLSMIGLTVTSLFPAILLTKKLGVFQILLFVIAFTSILLTMRRSAFLCSVFCVLIVAGIKLLDRKVGTKEKFAIAHWLMVSFLVMFNFFTNTDYGNIFAKRMHDLNFYAGGTASGRTIIQRIGVEHIYERDTPSTFFGEGLGSAERLLNAEIGNSIGMHSDWLDIAMSFGLVGFFLLTILGFNLILLLLGQFRRSHFCYHTQVFMCIVFIWIFWSFSSGGTLDPSFSMIYATLGLLLAQQKRNWGHCCYV